MNRYTILLLLFVSSMVSLVIARGGVVPTIVSPALPQEKDLEAIAQKTNSGIIKTIKDIPEERLATRPKTVGLPGPLSGWSHGGGFSYSYLDLSGLGLTDITGIDQIIIPGSRGPRPLTSIPNLILDLSNNDLADLPDDIAKLKLLRWLIVKNNQLVKLPESLGDLKTLEFLNLGHNKLRILPDSLQALNKLRHLYLGDNNLQQIALPAHLVTLVLSNNNLGDFYNDAQSELLLPKTLKSLYLNNNHLTSTALEKFRNIFFVPKFNILDLDDDIARLIGERKNEAIETNLGVLDLAHNALTTLPHLVIAPSLTVLSLANNQVDALPDDFLSYAPKLQSLFLGYNRLMTIPEDSLPYSSDLEHLDIRNNKLIALPSSLDNLEHLDTLNLIGNSDLPILTLENNDANGKNLPSTLIYLEGPVEKRKKMSKLLTVVYRNRHLKYFDLLREIRLQKDPNYLLKRRLSERENEEIVRQL